MAMTREQAQATAQRYANTQGSSAYVMRRGDNYTATHTLPMRGWRLAMIVQPASIVALVQAMATTPTPLQDVEVTLQMNRQAWNVLAAQKLWLLSQRNSAADGLVSLIDAIQDQAVDSGQVPHEVVFPDLEA